MDKNKKISFWDTNEGFQSKNAVHSHANATCRLKTITDLLQYNINDTLSLNI